MLGFVLITQFPICVQERTSKHVVLRTNERLESGAYDIYCEGMKVSIFTPFCKPPG